MDRTFRYRKVLARRILEGVGLAALVVPVAEGAGCGGKVVVEDVLHAGDGGGGSGGAGGGASGCEPTTVGATSGTGAGLVQQYTNCFAWPGGNGCPVEEVAATIVIPTSCGQILSVDCGPIEQEGSCCYVVTERIEGCLGRPFRVAGAAVASRADACARGWSDAEVAPCLDALSSEERESLAQAFTADALLEHASVASFAHASLELLAVGAPAELVAGAHRAAIDEVQHARLCFALAQAYGGRPLGPSPFPFNRSVAVSEDLADIAARAARDGCIGETLAALVAAEQLARATDPAVRRALGVIARDEARHAELAWRTVAWALAAGGAPVHAAVSRVFADARAHAAWPRGAASSPALEAHGLLDASDLASAVRRAVADVVEPCAQALLASRPAAARASAVVTARPNTAADEPARRAS